MTSQEQKQALLMRADGASWEEIAQRLGYTVPAVYQDIRNLILRGKKQARCVYPALQRVITDQHGGAAYGLARAAKLPPSTLYHVLSGRGDPSEQTRQAIARATGLREEEAFYREEEDP